MCARKDHRKLEKLPGFSEGPSSLACHACSMLKASQCSKREWCLLEDQPQASLGGTNPVLEVPKVRSSDIGFLWTLKVDVLEHLHV